MPDEFVNVRYMVDDVENAVAFYTNHFGFELRSSAAPAFADVIRGHLRLLLSGPASSAGRPMPDGRTPQPGGWNRIHLIVEDLAGEVERLRAAGLTFRNDIVSGPGGQQILLDDPAGNPIEASSNPLAPSLKILLTIRRSIRLDRMVRVAVQRQACVRAADNDDTVSLRR